MAPDGTCTIRALSTDPCRDFAQSLPAHSDMAIGPLIRRLFGRQKTGITALNGAISIDRDGYLERMADFVTATRQPRRYMIVGLVCAAIHNGLMIASSSFGVQYIIALAISFLILTPTAYMLHSLFTFELGIAPVRFLRFTGGLLTGTAINLALMILFVSVMELKVPIATFVCTGLLFLWNYISARWAISAVRT